MKKIFVKCQYFPLNSIKWSWRDQSAHLTNRSILGRRRKWMRKDRMGNCRWGRGAQMKVGSHCLHCYLHCHHRSSLSIAEETNRCASLRFLLLTSDLALNVSSTVLKDQKVMAGEACDRRNVWEPSVYYALGKESFHFVGHDISIRESMDTFGALIWPGVCAVNH